MKVTHLDELQKHVQIEMTTHFFMGSFFCKPKTAVKYLIYKTKGGEIVESWGWWHMVEYLCNNHLVISPDDKSVFDGITVWIDDSVMFLLK